MFYSLLETTTEIIKKEKKGFQSFRWSEPAAEPGGESPAAAKLCLCCEECTPLPEFASSRRTDHPSRPHQGAVGC